MNKKEEICTNTREIQKFCNNLVYSSLQHIYHLNEAVQAVVNTRSSWQYHISWWADTLLHLMCDLKVVQMSIQYSLIQELMIYKFELSHNSIETTKRVCFVKGEGTVHQSTVTKWFKKVCLCHKNLDDWARSIRPKTMHSMAKLQALETNSMKNTQRVSGKLCISQSSVISHLHDLG